ncbi:hypothetical protein HDU78_007008 [Chytriomyces hyalinus]|uniref:RING-type domain-containing protein n=1 Tax=Chytriomyces confervae TaxID=246404 RepID=A0A507EHT7_9FUNG|nr:hypothetical protein HDU78_007008 [Chytriomyces hyalinus]KAJ3255603.1 hypothetical protein HDU77_003566 [Chytriomyces hyalinus]KAJ3397342.1 hypothetical protein HDU80_009599 [Chytriomyces hyalinus]TPX63352.1 hypothetical protein CcCBS67573_g08708 [Chytriomyces confervae]
MATYYEEHDMEDPNARRRNNNNNGELNPNLDDFMAVAPTPTPTSTSTRTSEQETILGLASIFTSLRSNPAVQASGDQQQVLESLISQLNQDAQFGTQGKPPASKFFVRNLPSVKAPSNPCAICVEHFTATEDDPAKILPCKHIFHKQCLTPWLKLHNTCPFCRFEVQTDDAVYERDRKKRMKVEAKKRGLDLDDDDDDEDPMGHMYG